MVAIVVLALSLAAGGTLAADEQPSETGTFSPAGTLAKARGGHTATLLPDGRVLVVGGWDGEQYHASSEVWDPATEMFGPAGSLAQVRRKHTATLLPDGRVLIVGGWDLDAIVRDEDPLASAEVWRPSDG